MKKLSLLIGVLLGALPVHAVKIGDTLEQVLLEKGQPDRRLQAGANLLLTYRSGSIKLTNNKVVAIKTAEELASPNLKFTPATAPAVAAPSARKPGGWTTNAPAAFTQAKAESKKIFLFFTGSDWCVWCQRLDSEILSTDAFKAFAQENLVLVKVDFPRDQPQSDDLKSQNYQLAKKYGIDGYPTIIVLNSSGQKVGELGYQDGGAGPFVEALKAM